MILCSTLFLYMSIEKDQQDQRHQPHQGHATRIIHPRFIHLNQRCQDDEE